MAYITKDELEKRLSKEYLLMIADDDQDGVLDEQVIDEAISQAQSEVDTYIGTRYEVPISDPPQVVKKLTADLAIYYLHMRKDNMPEAVQKLYDGALKLLTLIAQGKVTLGVTEEAEQTSGSAIMIKARDRLFGSLLEEMP